MDTHDSEDKRIEPCGVRSSCLTAEIHHGSDPKRQAIVVVKSGSALRRFGAEKMWKDSCGY